MPFEVPSHSEFSDLESRVKGLERGASRPGIVVCPEDYGAVPGSDSTEAFRRMMDEIDSKLRTDEGGGVPVAQVEVRLHGSYKVSGTIMRPKSGRAQGLTFRGSGKRTSEIVMTGPGPLFHNADRWMNVRFYDCSFRSTNPDAYFLYSESTGAAQDWGFVNCEWRGTWKYGIGLDGPSSSNCNSEWFFHNCHVNGRYDVAFLWSGMSPKFPQQDQFLNFWFRDMKVEYDSGDFLRFDKGGYIVVDGGSFIIKGRRPDGEVSRFFHFPDTGSHYDSVQMLTVRGVRFELRHAEDRVIESNWSGHIVFDACSDTALGFQSHSTSLPAHLYTNPGMVSYRDCDLVGKHVYYQTKSPVRQRVLYSMCTRKNNRTRNSFLSVNGSYASKMTIIHEHDGDGIV